jgi:hypothetical protein
VEPRSQVAFLALILVQAAHSVEEYVMGLYDVFAPARLVSGLVSDDLATGFLVVNAGLVAFGAWCYVAPVRSGWPSARGLVWFWVVLELGNGVGHLILAASRGGYFPGVATAPLLLATAIALAFLLWRSPA